MRDDIENFPVTAAATGGTVSYILNRLEGLQDVIEALQTMQRLYYIVIRYLLTIAYDYVFHSIFL